MQMPATKTWLRTLYGNRPDMLAIATNHADRILANLGAAWNQSKNSAQSIQDRYLHLIKAADGEIDNILSQAGDIPCRLGCNYCCRNEKIPATDTEARLIARHIEEYLPAEARERVVSSILSSSPTSDKASVPCAFLIDGACAVYESRPMACRSYFSVSEPSCRSFLEDKSKTPQHFMAPKLVEYAVREVCRAAKHSKSYEINSLFLRIYSDPEKPALWAKGNMTDESDIADK